MDTLQLASYIDHTILKPDTSKDDIRNLCAEAMQHQFKSVCVPPFYVKFAKDALSLTPCKVATVVGFPLGYQTMVAKGVEIQQALRDGADELDVVINISMVKSNYWELLREEIFGLTYIIQAEEKVVKFIVETCLLTPDELEKVCQILGEAQVDFAKTSTGFNGAGATPEIVTKMRSSLPSYVKIKASGGIKTKVQALALIEAGADRIGTSSSVAIITS